MSVYLSVRHVRWQGGKQKNRLFPPKIHMEGNIPNINVTYYSHKQMEGQ
jgi:hypothetical protein